MTDYSLPNLNIFKFGRTKLKALAVLCFPTIFSVFVNFVVGKLIAVNISPSEYGIYSIQFVMFSLLNSIFFVSVINGYKTFYEEHMPNEVFRFDNLIYLVTIVSTLLLLLVGNSFDSSINVIPIAIIAVNLLVQNLFNLRLADFNLKSDFNNHGYYTIITGCLNLVFAILILVFFQYKSYYAIWAIITCYTFLTLGIITKKYSFSRIDIFNFRNFLHKKYYNYFFPLVILALFTTINNYADRLIISKLLSKYELGIYSAAYGVGSKITMLMTIILLYITPLVYDKAKNHLQDAKNVIINSILFHFILGIGCCVALFLLRNYVGYLFLARSYQEGFILIPLIAFAFIIYNSIFAIETIFFALGKTKYMLYHNILGALVNITLNLLLIPSYGLMGAAIASMVSYTLQLLTIFIFFRRL